MILPKSSSLLSDLAAKVGVAKTCAVHGWYKRQRYGNNIATNVKTSTLFTWGNLFHVFSFLNTNSKELFDYGLGIQKTKGRLLE